MPSNHHSEQMPPKVAPQTPEERFHAHLDTCRRCEDHPFDLCPIGALLLALAACA